MSDPNSIEIAIQNRLQSLAGEAKDDWNAAKWTREVKNALVSLGTKEYGFQVYAAGCDGIEDSQEWLYDAVWLTYKDHVLLDAPLVVESEWAPRGENDDFDKLVVARATHRLFVFSAWTEDRARQRFNELRQRIHSFRLTIPGDRYLLACWTNQTRGFVFDQCIPK